MEEEQKKEWAGQPLLKSLVERPRCHVGHCPRCPRCPPTSGCAEGGRCGPPAQTREDSDGHCPFLGQRTDTKWTAADFGTRTYDYAHMQIAHNGHGRTVQRSDPPRTSLVRPLRHHCPPRSEDTGRHLALRRIGGKAVCLRFFFFWLHKGGLGWPFCCRRRRPPHPPGPRPGLLAASGCSSPELWPMTETASRVRCRRSQRPRQSSRPRSLARS